LASYHMIVPQRDGLLGFAGLRGDLISFAPTFQDVSTVGKRAVPSSLPIVLTHQLAWFGVGFVSAHLPAAKQIDAEPQAPHGNQEEHSSQSNGVDDLNVQYPPKSIQERKEAQHDREKTESRLL